MTVQERTEHRMQKSKARADKQPNPRFKLPQVLRLLLWGLGMTLVVESFCRRNPGEAVAFIWEHPLPFLYSCIVLTAWMSLSLLFRRQKFAFLVLGTVWLALAIANCVLLGFRVTPLSAVDFSLLQSVSKIFTVYLEPGEIVVIGVGIVGVAALLVWAFRRCGKQAVHWKTAIPLTLSYVGLAVVCTVVFIQTGALSSTFANLSEDYKDNGFIYCFGRSVFDRGIDRPKAYSEQSVDEILDSIQRPAESNPRKDVNIIFVQLESFFDVMHLEDLTFSENPIPVFTTLQASCSTGYLTVPSVGAGTANTEFEVISGMSLDYFGTGEYPYKTVLKSSTCESVCYNLDTYGYTSHAIHNNSASFYDRYHVFSNLGFDTFTSVELMQNVEYNSLGWAKDKVLTQSILDALNSTEGPDFVYTISVQPHGKYPKTTPETPYPITVQGIEDEGLTLSMEYYLSQLKETDAFLGNLVRELNLLDEPVVLVAYGDHLPNFDIENEDLNNRDIFQTEYVLWSNCGLEKEDQDVSAYQLTALVQERLDMHSGVLTRLHQNYINNPNYQSALEMLEYDMLYGDQRAYDSGQPYQHTDLQMGVNPITISGLVRGNKVSIVNGTGFTPYSVVYINDEAVETKLLGVSRLSFPTQALANGGTLYVVQVAENGTELKRSKGYTLPNLPKNVLPNFESSSQEEDSDSLSGTEQTAASETETQDGGSDAQPQTTAQEAG